VGAALNGGYLLKTRSLWMVAIGIVVSTVRRWSVDPCTQ